MWFTLTLAVELYSVNSHLTNIVQFISVIYCHCILACWRLMTWIKLFLRFPRLVLCFIRRSWKHAGYQNQGKFFETEIVSYDCWCSMIPISRLMRKGQFSPNVAFGADLSCKNILAVERPDIFNRAWRRQCSFLVVRRTFSLLADLHWVAHLMAVDWIASSLVKCGICQAACP